MKSVYEYLTEKRVSTSSVSNKITDVRIVEKSDDFDEVKKLLAEGVDPNSRDAKGITALMTTSDIDVAKLLIEHGADVNMQDKKGWTALHYCAEDSDYEEMAKFLIKNNADINIRNQDKDLPTDVAIYENEYEMFEAINPNAPLAKYFEHHVSYVRDATDTPKGEVEIKTEFSNLKSCYNSRRGESFDTLEKWAEGDEMLQDIEFSTYFPSAFDDLDEENLKKIEELSKNDGWDMEEVDLDDFLVSNKTDVYYDILTAQESATRDEYSEYFERAFDSAMSEADIHVKEGYAYITLSRDKAKECFENQWSNLEDFVEIEGVFVNDNGGYDVKNFNDILRDYI